jgi:hypothetical protein
VVPLDVFSKLNRPPVVGQTADISVPFGSQIRNLPPGMVSRTKPITAPPPGAIPPVEQQQATSATLGAQDLEFQAAAGQGENFYRATQGPETFLGTWKDKLKAGGKIEPEGNAPLVNFAEFAPDDMPLVKGVADVLSSLTAPSLSNAALWSSGALMRLATGPLGRAVSLGFSVDMLSEFPEQGRQFRAALDAGDIDGAERILGQMMAAGGLIGLTGAHGAGLGGKQYKDFPGAREAVRKTGEFLGFRPRPEPKTGEILTDQPLPGGQRRLAEGEAFVEPSITVEGPPRARTPEPRLNVEAEPIRPRAFEEPIVETTKAPRGTLEPKVETEGALGETKPAIPETLPPGWEPAPIEKTWIPGHRGRLKPAEPYVEELIRQKEAAEEQRDVARRELEVHPKTGYGSAAALQRALPTAELDPETEIASLDVANMKARNDLDSPQAGDREIKAAAEAVAQASKELGLPPRVFTPKGDEIYAIGPKGSMAELVERAKAIYGERPIGDSEYSNYLRGGAGDTQAEADAAMGSAKAGETAKKYRKLTRKGKPLFEDVSRVPLKDLDLEPERMQFKLGAPAERAEAPAEPEVKAEAPAEVKPTETLVKREVPGEGLPASNIPERETPEPTITPEETPEEAKAEPKVETPVTPLQHAIQLVQKGTPTAEIVQTLKTAYKSGEQQARNIEERAHQSLQPKIVTPQVLPRKSEEPPVTMESVAKGMADAAAESRKQAEAELIRSGKGKVTRRMGDVRGPLFGTEEPTVQGEMFGAEKKPPSGEASEGGYKPGLAPVEPRVEREGPETEAGAARPGPERAAYANLERARVEMPELVEIAQAINEGKLPALKKFLGRALGRMTHTEGPGAAADIKLRRDLFIGERLARKVVPAKGSAEAFDEFKQRIRQSSGIPEADLHFTKEYNRRKGMWEFLAYRKDPTLAPKVMAHELGHLIDWVADSKDPDTHQMLDRGNLLGRIASLKEHLKHTLPGWPGGPAGLTDKDRRRIRKLANDALKTDAEIGIDEVIKKETPYTPDEVLAIWRNTVASAEGIDKRLYEYIARLDRATKKQVVVEAMKGKTPGPPVFPDFPTKVTMEKTGRVLRRKGKPDPKEVSKKYRELIIEEIRKRALLENETVSDELKAVTQYWKPFNEDMVDPKYRDYRYSGKELYADAFSVLMNEPDKLQQMAPNFWRGIFNYMERKPDVKESYDDIQARLGGGGGGNIPPRLGRVEDMFEEGRNRREELNKRRRSRVEDATNWLMRKLIDRSQGALKSVRKGERQGGIMGAAASEARYDLEEIQYLASEAGNYLEDIGSQVLQPIRKAGLTPDQLGTYQFLTRIAEGERELMGNPLGYSEATARKTLDGMKTELGAEKFGKLEEAAAEFRRLREDLIIPRAEASGIYSPELIELMKDHKAYVRFGVSHWLDKTYGPGVSARVYKQVGTLSGIENPLVVTALQDMAVLRSAKVNESKRSLIDHFRLNDPEAFTPAEMKWDANVGARVPKEPANPRQALMTYLDKGKPVHVYVSEAIAKSYEAQPFEATKIAEVMASGMSLLRDIFVAKNPLWMARNVFRDIRQTYKNLPEIGALNPKDAARLARAYNDAFREAWRYLMKGERSEDIGEMQRGRMLLPGRAYEAREQTFENELERQAAEFLVDTGAAREASGARAKLAKLSDYLNRLGRLSEIPGKIAAFKYLKPGWRTQKEIGHVVRTRAATPDIKRQGEAQALTNNLFLFSNVNKEGWRSSWESFNEDRSGYAWKTVAANMLPKLLLAAGAAGLGGSILKRIIDGMSEYDKSNYTSIPLGLDKNGKSIYLRIPEDYEGQFWSALAWKLAHGRVMGKGGAVNLTAEQVPWSPTKLNPYLKVGGDLLDYYGYGNNPTDEWRGRPVLTDLEFEAGGTAAASGLAKHSWRELGGTVLYDPARNELVKTKTPVEEILRSFPGNILGAFLKISDQGIADRLRDVRQEVRQEKAAGTLDVQGRIQKSINAAVKAKGKPDRGDMRQLYRELRSEGKVSRDVSETEFQSRYFRWAARVPGNPYLEAIINAQSNTEKERLLMEYRKILSPAEYERLLGEMMRARTQSPSSFRKLERESRRNEPQVQPGR